MPSDNRKLQSVPVAMEPDLREWLDAEAARTGQNRSAYVRRLIEREREHQTSERIAALERRIATLEQKGKTP
ncbi:MAG: ribbon-helix-helix protein, CopG family [Rhodobacteraceae bacterium]|nr:ribbon-helix-helix protein, CopG family [Paracoccaceae bacterium]